MIARCATPRAAQRWIRSLNYNWEEDGETLRSFRGVVAHQSAHCLEAALAAATVLEQHGRPPLLLDLESQDGLDHVVCAFRSNGRWGAIGGSRDMGLWGRRPVFRSVEALARSYYDPYVDLTGRIVGYALVDLRVLDPYDWRLSDRNVWKVERFLIEVPHRPIHTDDRRYIRLRECYREFIRDHDARDTPFTRGRKHWM
ncbi:MAG: hypothetical protein GTN62_11935 [Gemmatimonadales bacterium]|nr:hypothetical protein [Gemmatimonadales bacterium]NIN12429.1 hypothetical protein [Gemmatimonadales bacterium]NIN50805.1 hypothetical protein [Gemmatimonadales bacterium]NIP08269.1 hypothetical protein [Gemmatimonadales bacterium]NIR00793.1 hypothetical protein [Gemmatimonadales bacterium]